MKLDIYRLIETDRSIVGHVAVDGQQFCFDLEASRFKPVHAGHPCRHVAAVREHRNFVRRSTTRTTPGCSRLQLCGFERIAAHQHQPEHIDRRDQRHAHCRRNLHVHDQGDCFVGKRGDAEFLDHDLRSGFERRRSVHFPELTAADCSTARRLRWDEAALRTATKHHIGSILVNPPRTTCMG